MSQRTAFQIPTKIGIDPLIGITGYYFTGYKPQDVRSYQLSPERPKKNSDIMGVYEDLSTDKLVQDSPLVAEALVIPLRSLAKRLHGNQVDWLANATWHLTIWRRY